MQKKIIISIIALTIFGTIFIISKNNNPPADNQTDPSSKNAPMSPAKISADTIEVVHFHATQQCWSCITVGEYALKTIKEKFPEEYKNRTIIFRDINGELPENKALVAKYQARGSSLFVNAITAGKDNIKEDTAVWRLVSNETQFITYFQNKLNKLLGK